MKTTLYWNSNYKMGIPELDEQHKTLFNIYLKLDEIYKSGFSPNNDYIWSVLTQLKSYARKHIITEENILRKASYPEYEEQCNNHELFLRMIHQFTVELSYENPLIIENLLLFVKKWLISHILKEDRKYKECVILYLISKEKK